ncbi:MAG: glycosyltransferase [Nitrospirae bacterium]|nr:glycosyltransferase [Nitrospirota bacterium]
MSRLTGGFGTLMKKIAVMIPCLNEELTIAKVVKDFKAALPDAEVYVFDNNSTDGTSGCAEDAGAIVIHSPNRGKGNVVKHMFEEIDADIYVMCDGDDTYPSGAVKELIEALKRSDAGMVVGARLQHHMPGSFRVFHKAGNWMVKLLVSRLFSITVTDVLSGFRVFSREFVKSVPLKSKGFEIETELTLQAITKNFAIKEIPVHYGLRPEGSHSKINTFSDGILILKALFMILKDYKPLLFFSLLAAIFLATSLITGYLPIRDYITTRYVYHVPLSILAASCGILSAIMISIGLILDTISKYQHENFLLFKKVLNQKIRRDDAGN